MVTQNEVSVTAAPASHLDAAQTLVNDIRAMRQRIPNLVIPNSKGSLRRLAQAASVPKQFVDLAAMAVTNNPALVREGGQDLAQNRDLSSYAEAYGLVADELEALAYFVRHSVTAAKNKVGNEALTTYALARRLAKLPETADLTPHVDDMSKALGKRSRKSKSQPVPTPATPDTNPTQPSPVTTTAARTR